MVEYTHAEMHILYCSYYRFEISFDYSGRSNVKGISL